MKQIQPILSAQLLPTSLVQSGALADELPDEVIDLAEGPDLEQRDLVIPTAMHGERLDRALAQLLPEFSRSYSQQLLAEGCVNCVLPEARLINKPSIKVRAGCWEVLATALAPSPFLRWFCCVISIARAD